MAQSDPGLRASRPKSGQSQKLAIVCVDDTSNARNVVLHALAVTEPLGASAILLHVLEAAPGSNSRPTDPIDWALRRRYAQETLRRLCAGHPAADTLVAELVEGPAADQISRRIRNQDASLVVLGTCGDNGPSSCRLGLTAQDVIEKARTSVLLVPPGADGTAPVRYRRILVPFDGSSAAESVFPLALRLAAAHDAELLLVHVIPTPELMKLGPEGPEYIDLRDRVIAYNRHVAERHLDRLRVRAARNGIKARILVLQGDPRSRLKSLAADEDIGLVLISSHGRGDRRDMLCGSVASYLITRLHTPVLMVRPQDTFVPPQLGSEPAYHRLRLPDRAAS